MILYLVYIYSIYIYKMFYIHILYRVVYTGVQVDSANISHGALFIESWKILCEFKS